MAEDAGGASVGSRQGREDPQGGRLARPVGAEEPEHLAPPDHEVDPGDRLELAVALGEATGFDGGPVAGCHDHRELCNGPAAAQLTRI